ncbi:uncharacterized protein LOC26536056 [Drosophila yakuba]|uniref:Uncharacterized protein, isoform A n=1 Tax=Drosophila yakuba TaxID=7245 RepID=A0A0R1EA45_DROYA|nr:uncharacterized protein LOC26536056 [Drosophila yakuba]XP_015045717.1 uncharacterized protein LOC26536056 [Drosophila yakuba]KRK06156.1 uncharacterized protein Dyak_GE28875, isoform A [Drosophila yakuba]KRK06157.1 uncharacterized protein Dyak_GE28875, isoform B [Drosophila yakuba]
MNRKSRDRVRRRPNNGAGDRAVEDFLAELGRWSTDMPSRSSSTSSVSSSTESTGVTSYRRGLRRVRAIVISAPPSMGELFSQNVRGGTPSTIAWRCKIALLYLGLVVAPVILELGPRIEFPEQWNQAGRFQFLKERRLALTFTLNTTREVIRSFLSAAVPLYSMLCMAHPNRFLLCAPQARSRHIEVPANVSLFFLGLLPYVLRLHAGFYVFVRDTWMAYNDHVLSIAETFNSWRILIYLNQVMQLVYSIELVLLMAQGFMSFLHARRIYKLVAGKGNFYVAQLEQDKSKFWYIPSKYTMHVYRAFQERVYELE